MSQDSKLDARLTHTHDHELGFDHWRQRVGVRLKDSKQSKYLLYREQLHLSRQHLDSLLADTTSNLDVLASLSTAFESVESQTSAFRDRCDTLVADQSKLSQLADDVSLNLQYYNFLDPMTRRLNAPGAGHVVKSQDFPDMLSKLDSCLEYMETHPKQKESATYKARYRLLLTRALTLIRVHFTNTLRETAADVSTRIADRQLNDTTMPALLYAKFRVGAPELRRLGFQIQKRAIPPPGSEPGAQGEYQSLLNELYQSYSASRGRLIVPIIRRKMAELAAAPSSLSDLVTFTRSTVGYIRSVCLDEYELWHEWFEGDGGLYEFLEAMCEPLYDYLRPRTIKETQLAKLCEMCSLLQVQYVEEPDDDDDDSATVEGQLDFGPLIRPALEDAQTRLVFLAISYLRNEIERFRPKASELEMMIQDRTQAQRKGNGPALSGTREPRGVSTVPAPDVHDQTVKPGDQGWDMDSSSAYESWYPTLRKAIWLLSRIYHLVNSTVFDDLAHQIVHQTTTSLEQAALLLASKASRVESQLFLLKQLLILKSQIVAFDIEFVTPELNLDFSSVTSTFWELRERGGLFNPRNLIKLVGGGLMPGVVENMLDAKAELDAKLRTVINDFISDYATKFTEAVMGKKSEAPGFVGGAAVQTVRTTIEKELPLLRQKLDRFLDDGRTRETLVGAVRDQSLSNYEEFFEKFTKSVAARGKEVSKKGKSHEEEVWDPDMFADWCIKVFGVGAEQDIWDDDDEDGVESISSELNGTASS